MYRYLAKRMRPGPSLFKPVAKQALVLFIVGLAVVYMVACTIYIRWNTDYYVCTATRGPTQRYLTPAHHDPVIDETTYDQPTPAEGPAEFIQRTERQQTIVNRICRKQKVEGIEYVRGNLLHTLNETSYNNMLSHLWYDDFSKSIYCAVQKENRSTTTTTKMYDHFVPLVHLLMQSEEVTEATQISPLMADIYKRHGGLKLLDSRLSTYYLFTTFQNPLVRLMDLYHTKLENPTNSPQYTAIRNEILQHYRRLEYTSWLNQNKSYDLKPTFGNFIQYFISMNENEHHDGFESFMEACQPCVMHYHYYMHPNFLNRDIESLSRAKGTSFYVEPLLDHSETSGPELLQEYYSQLTLPLMNLLRAKLKYELELYNALHPEERMKNEQLLYM